MTNNEKLFKFVEKLLKGHPYKIIISKESEYDFVEFNDLHGGTYLDFDYKKFNEKDLKKELLENIKDSSMHCFDEYKRLADLILEPLKSYVPSMLKAKKITPPKEDLLWNKVWDMFEAVPYYDRFQEKDKLIKSLKKKFKIS
jgi:hypothetical protein